MTTARLIGIAYWTHRNLWSTLNGRLVSSRRLAAACSADRCIGSWLLSPQRAQALPQEATVILADEPVASLDPESAATVLDTLRSVAARGVAVIASLHQVGLATDYVDRIIALRDGQVLEDAPTRTFDARALEQIYERSVAPAGGVAGV